MTEVAEAVLHEHPDKFELAVCPLPLCSKTLHIIYEGGGAIYATDRNADLAGRGRPDGQDFRSWKVECEAGHVVLLPTDCSDAECRMFGECDCSDFEDIGVHHELCGVFDLARLRAVSGVGRIDREPF